MTWGSWTGADRPLADGEIAGFNYMLTDPNNITTAAQLGALNSNGSVTFADIGGPSAVGSNGGNWSVNFISMGVDFSAGVIDSAQISVTHNESTTIQLSDNFSDNSGVAFNSDGSFVIPDMEEVEVSRYSGSLAGHFIGTDANGALVAFEVREIDGEQRIVGSQVLEQQ